MLRMLELREPVKTHGSLTEGEMVHEQWAVLLCACTACSSLCRFVTTIKHHSPCTDGMKAYLGHDKGCCCC